MQRIEYRALTAVTNLPQAPTPSQKHSDAAEKETAQKSLDRDLVKT